MADLDSRCTALTNLYQHACWIDMHALKPGNTGVHSRNPSPSVEDFLDSAEASAPSLTTPYLTLGERILQAVQATQKMVGTNTNLGIILLIAPMVQAILDKKTVSGYAKLLADVLLESTVEDAKNVYQAIRIARPGGIGRKKIQDIFEEPTVTLLNTMKIASSWDSVARQYSNNFHDILFFGVPRFKDLMTRWQDECWAATGLYISFLARFQDSLIERKFGILKARSISDMISRLEKEFYSSDSPVKYKAQLLEIDSHLRRDHVNPGTTADLTVASIFAAGLDML